MGTFRFKRFDVVNERSAMKVNTDGVLLGASMTVKPSDRNLLDIGTGTGTIALMAAQRLAGMQEDGLNPPVINAIDIDEASAAEAGVNFRNSPWPETLHAYHSSLDEYEKSADECRYDLIFSNPPYFDDSLTAPEKRRNNARHTSTGLSYREILIFAAGHLSADGRVSLVLPAETEAALCRQARMCGLHLFRIVRVRTVPRKPPVRIVAEFSRKRCPEPEEAALTIQDDGKYTREYLSVMHDFYLFA